MSEELDEMRYCFHEEGAPGDVPEREGYLQAGTFLLPEGTEYPGQRGYLSLTRGWHESVHTFTI